MIKLKAKEFIFTKMELHILENGLMTNNMVMEYKDGLMELLTKEHLKTERRKDMESLFGEMEADLKENSKIIVLKGLVIMYGLMVDNMKEFGKVIK